MKKTEPITYYPVYLDISGKRCVIVGGGEVAARKAQRLAQCGAEVSVLSRKLVPEIQQMKAAGHIHHIDDDYNQRYIGDAFLVIGATDQDEVNGQISADARKLGIMVNIVDDPARCDFILPSIMNRGDLSIAVSTGGKSPALAKKLRQELEKQYGPEYQILLDIMAILRKKITTGEQSSQEKRESFEAIINSDILDAIRSRNSIRIGKLIKDLTGQDITWEF